MVQRYIDDEKLETEYYPLTKAEAKLIAEWAQQVFDNKQFRFTTMDIRGWTIFLPKRIVEIRPLMSPLQRLVEAISRHPAAEDDPEVIDAINAVEDALKGNQDAQN